MASFEVSKGGGVTPALLLRSQRLVFDGARARDVTPRLPDVITAGRNFQLLAEPENGMVVFHRVDPFIFFENGSERILSWQVPVRPHRSVMASGQSKLYAVDYD